MQNRVMLRKVQGAYEALRNTPACGYSSCCVCACSKGTRTADSLPEGLPQQLPFNRSLFKLPAHLFAVLSSCALVQWTYDSGVCAHAVKA
jgi:hypothetical protein